MQPTSFDAAPKLSPPVPYVAGRHPTEELPLTIIAIDAQLEPIRELRLNVAPTKISVGELKARIEREARNAPHETTYSAYSPSLADSLADTSAAAASFPATKQRLFHMQR